MRASIVYSVALIVLVACGGEGTLPLEAPVELAPIGDSRIVPSFDRADRRNDNSLDGVIGRLGSVHRIMQVLDNRMKVMLGGFTVPEADNAALTELLGHVMLRSQYVRDLAAFLEGAVCGTTAERPGPPAGISGTVSEKDSYDADELDLVTLLDRLNSVSNVLGNVSKRMDDISDVLVPPPGAILPPNPCVPDVLAALAAIQGEGQRVMEAAQAMLDQMAPPAPPPFSAATVALDGVDDVVDMGGVAYNLDGFEAFSLSIWYRADVAAEAHLIGRQNPGVSKRGYYLHLNAAGEVCFTRSANLLSAFARECTLTPPALGQWHHLVVTNGTGGTSFDNMKLYVDGVEVATNAAGRDLGMLSVASSGGNFAVGAAVCAPGTFCPVNGSQVSMASPFGGRVDEAAIFLLALTADQVTEIYNGGTPADFAGLTLTPAPQSWWRMGECTDAAKLSVCDEMNSVLGTLRNGAAFDAFIVP